MLIALLSYLLWLCLGIMGLSIVVFFCAPHRLAQKLLPVVLICVYLFPWGCLFASKLGSL